VQSMVSDGIIFFLEDIETLVRMCWISFSFRTLLMISLISGILYWAEQTFPMGGLLVFLLATSIGITVLVINLLKNNDVITDLFD
jgi:hypothetical protein